MRREDTDMRRSRYTAGIVTVLAVLTSLVTHAADAQNWHHEFETAKAEAERLDKPMLLHFYADWCFPCRRMDQEVFSRPGVFPLMQERVVCVKVNVDRRPDLAQRFGVSQYPSDVIIQPGGERIVASTGFLAAVPYMNFIGAGQTQYLATRTPTVPVKIEVPEVPAPEEPALIALDGYSPVTLYDSRSWVKGDEHFAVEHRGQTFYLASAEERTLFEEDPRKYVPCLLGCDPVILHETEMVVPGSVKFGAFFDNELYLFQSDETRTAFKKSPDRFTRTRVVLSADQLRQTAQK